MRSYLTGVTSTSIWKAYEGGAREFCGHSLPDGMVRHQKLPRPILTPSTKAPKGEHDISVSREQLLEMGVITVDHFERAAEIARSLFEFGQRRAAERGMILVCLRQACAMWLCYSAFATLDSVVSSSTRFRPRCLARPSSRHFSK